MGIVLGILILSGIGLIAIIGLIVYSFNKMINKIDSYNDDTLEDK